MDDIALLVSIAEAAMYGEMYPAEELKGELRGADRVTKVIEYFLGVK